MPKIILASNSMQKRKLLEEYGFSFQAVDIDVDETPVKVYSLQNHLKDISMRKALSAMDKLNTDEDYIIVSSDQKNEHTQESNQIHIYVGNTVLHVSCGKIYNYINECDIVKLQTDCISDGFCTTLDHLKNMLSKF